MSLFDLNPDALTISPARAALSATNGLGTLLTASAVVAALGVVCVVYMTLTSNADVRARLSLVAAALRDAIPAYVWAAFIVIPPLLFLVGFIR